MLLHARIEPAQINGLIIRTSRPSFCEFFIINFKMVDNLCQFNCFFKIFFNKKKLKYWPKRNINYFIVHLIILMDSKPLYLTINILYSDTKILYDKK